MPTTIEYRAGSSIDPTPDGYAGYAATFLTVDSYQTAFAKGAFRRSLKDRTRPLPVLWQHEATFGTIGRHITAKEDATGLYVDVALIDDGAQGSVALKQLRGDGGLGLSFGFDRQEDRSATDDDGLDLRQLPGVKASDIRLITRAALWETSVVTFPANELAVITAVRELARTATVPDPDPDPEPELELTSHPARDRRDRDALLVLAGVRARLLIGGGTLSCRS